MEPKTPYVALKDDKASSRSDAAKLLRDLDETHNRASSLKLTALALALAAALAPIGYRAAPPAAPAHTALVASTTVDWPALRADLAHFVHTCECAPILVRLAWHDSGTFDSVDGSGGSRAAQRFDEGESTDPANAGLGIARGLLRPFKQRYAPVSNADLWSLAAVVAISESGGPTVRFRAGRRDAKSVADSVAHGRLPDGALGADHLRAIFGRMGFADEEIVALSGAHTLGRCHADRSGFVGPWTKDPLVFDTAYFASLLSCDWYPTTASTGKPQMACASHPDLMMLNTDYALVTDAAFAGYVRRFAANKHDFFQAFASAFGRLIELGHQGLVEV